MAAARDSDAARRFARVRAPSRTEEIACLLAAHRGGHLRAKLFILFDCFLFLARRLLTYCLGDILGTARYDGGANP